LGAVLEFFHMLDTLSQALSQSRQWFSETAVRLLWRHHAALPSHRRATTLKGLDCDKSCALSAHSWANMCLGFGALDIVEFLREGLSCAFVTGTHFLQNLLHELG
jgi:hypothetical protein